MKSGFNCSYLRQVWFVACCAALAALIGLTSASAGGDEIRWRSGSTVQTVPAGAQQTVLEKLTELATQPAARRVVLQFSTPVDAEQRAALEDAGVTLLSYLGSNAFFATQHVDLLDILAIGRAVEIVSADAIDPMAKLAPLLVAGETPEWAVVNRGLGEPPVIGAYVVFHRDVELESEAVPVMGLYDANVRDRLETVNALVVELPLEVVYDLAAEDAVQWIEPALPRFCTNNNSNRIITQANDVQDSPYDLDGTGVSVLVYDGGTARASHDDFGGRLSVHDGSGVANHATHVSGTIGGDGSAGGGVYRGMAPGVTLLSYGFEYDGSGTFLYTNPGDIEDDYGAAIAMGAVIANNSIGTNIETNQFPCEYQGDYGLCSSVIDAIVRGSLSGGQPFRIVWAAGNERQGSRCDVEGYGDYYSTAPPAGAKNHLAIGAINSDNGSMTSFSSWGPVDDGRIKPDFCAPGCESGGDGGVTSCSSSGDDAYTTMCGTSMASPTICGLAALLIEDFRVQFPDEPDPRNSTLKVLFAQTASEVGNTGPDYQFGYGVVRIKYAIDFMRTGNFLEDDVSQGGSVDYVITVGTFDEWLKVTLAWDDYPGTPNVEPALVNDLDLRIYDPSGIRYYPWTLDPESPGVAAVQDREDHVNNIEQVRVRNPVAGDWRVEVVGHVVPEGPQPFSVCGTPGLTPLGIRIEFPTGVPALMLPGVGEVFDVEITAMAESLVSGSAVLHFRYDGGDWLEEALTPLGGDLYRAELPPGVCGATPEFYISVEGTASGVVTQPPNAPSAVFAADVGEFVLSFADDFETDQGWTVENSVDLTDGSWERGVPAGGGDRGDPPTDYDGSGRCYLTDNEDDNSDVDDGYTWLISPTLDLSAGDAEIHYALWYTNNAGNDPDNDLFKTFVSNDNGANWIPVETVGPVTSGGWVEHNFMVGDFVLPNEQVKVRFEASDLDVGSVVEAGVDDFRVGGFACSGTFDDCNGNGIVDGDDIASGRSQDVNGNEIPDECESVGCLGDVTFDGVIDLADLGELLGHYGMIEGATFADGDLDDDGDVDLSDLAILLGVYGESCG